MSFQLRVEIAAIGQAAGDSRLARLVEQVVQGLARLRVERALAGGDHGIVVRRTVHAQLQLAHAHRLAGLHVGDDHLTPGLFGQFGPHLDVVIAERLEGFANLLGRHP